jgi:hypothetical protein
MNEVKIRYISDRLGIPLSLADLISLKIVLNIQDLIRENNLELTRYPHIVETLDKYFMGFISYDNSFCTMRNVVDSDRINKSIRHRYINYNLVKKQDKNRDYYVIPTQIDVTHHIKIHIAEGAIDILSVCLNVLGGNRVDNIYIANGGKSYRQALEFILYETGIIDYEVHIYEDKDVSKQEFDKIFTYKCSPLPVDIYIHMNMVDGEKDYGVPKNRIRDCIISKL